MRPSQWPVLVLALVLCGCANLMPSQSPTRIFPHAHLFGSTAIAFSNDGKQLASGGYQGEILLWDTTDLHRTGELKLHHEAIRVLQYSARGQLISSGDDGLIIVWDAQDSKPIAHFQSSKVTALVARDETLITGHGDGFIRIWSLPKLTLIKEKKLDGEINAITSHEALLGIAYDNGRVALFDGELNLKRVLQEHGNTARDLHFSPDGRQLAAGNWFTMRLWDVASGKQKSIPAEHTGMIVSLDFSPDGRYLASLGRETDATIRLWNRDKLTVERRYQAHELCGAMIRFSPDGRYMASVSDDESVRLYDLALPYAPNSSFSPDIASVAR